MTLNDGRFVLIERQIAELSSLITKIGSQTDPDVCLNQARKTAEGICWCVFSDKIGSPQRLELDVYIRNLEKAGAMPLKIIASLKTIQGFGNLGSHFQVNVEPLSYEDIAPCLAALASATTWFFEEHLKIPPPARVSLTRPGVHSVVQGASEPRPSSAPTSVRMPPARIPPNADRTTREKRLATCEMAVAAAPNDADALYARGCCLRELGQFDDALRDATRILTLRPGDVGALRLRSVTYHAMGRLQDAVDSAAAVLRQEPEDEFARRISADSNRKLGNFDAALADVDHILAIRPNNAFGLCTRADVYRAARRFNDAIETATALLDIDGTNQVALSIRGECRLELGQLKAASEDATAILSDHPNSAYALNLRARVRRVAGDFDGALVDGRRAIEVQRDRPGPDAVPISRTRDSDSATEAAAFAATLERAIANAAEASALVDLAAYTFGLREVFSSAESLSDAFWLPGHWRGWYLQNRCKTEFDLHVILTSAHKIVGTSVEPADGRWVGAPTATNGLFFANIDGELASEDDGGNVTWRKTYRAPTKQQSLLYTATIPSFDRMVGDWAHQQSSGVFSASRAKGLATLSVIDLDQDATLLTVGRASSSCLDGTWVGVLLTRRGTACLVVHLAKTSIGRAEANIVRSLNGAIVLTHAEGHEDAEGVLSLRETRVVACGAAGATKATVVPLPEFLPLELRLLPNDSGASLQGTQEMGGKRGSVELRRAR